MEMMMELMMVVMMGAWLIVPLLLLGAAFYALGWRPKFNQTGPPPTSEAPAEILKSRYARGEISREEYDLLLSDLEG
jgi:uncharacterized membrane protein